MREFMALMGLVLVSACAKPAPVVSDVWARDTGGRTGTAAVFMTVNSPSADRLVSASTDVAAKTDLMTMGMAGGAMTMRYVQGIDLPAGRQVGLNPAGLHIWLEGLKKPLKAGERFPMTLRFEKAGTKQVDVTVIAASARSPQ